MTTSTPLRPATPPTGAAGGQPSPPPRRADRTAAGRTVVGFVASGLAAVPLKGLLQDFGWLVDVWLSMAVVLAPAALLRTRRAPAAVDIWPGIVLLIPWLTLRFVPTHAFAGLILTSGTMHDLSALMTSLHHTTADGVAPVHSTPAVRLVLCALLGLLAALIDLLAIVAHRAALAGVPILLIYMTSGAVPRHPVAWTWFACAAAGFLLLLSIDATDQLNGWGRRITRSGAKNDTSTRPIVSVSAQRIGLIAIVAAVVLPLVVPDQPRNLIADAFHSSRGGSGDGSGAGIGVGGSISPFAALKGELKRGKEVNLFTVHVTGVDPNSPPFYLRSNVLSKFSGHGWEAADHGLMTSVAGQDFVTDPETVDQNNRSYHARIRAIRSIGNPAIFAVPTGVQGVAPSAKWSPRDELLLDAEVRAGDVYEEDVSENVPTQQQLQAAKGLPRLMQPSLALPTIPASVVSLVHRLEDRALSATPYGYARAISNYFQDPANNFRYSLKTKEGDSGNDLVDFLNKRVGFCQQYAAAMAVMLRVADVPARVVLGYMHPLPDSHGNFTVTSFDAHAWVEAYFAGVGWVPFDPTPTDGLDGGPQSDIGYAPHTYPSDTEQQQHRNTTSNASSSSAAPSSGTTSSTAAAVAAAQAPRATDNTPWWVLSAIAIVLLAALTPAFARWQRRRRRFAAARRGDHDALWDELTDAAVDLGYPWSPARSPRQVATWLDSQLRTRSAPGPTTIHEPLNALAAAVEERRYAPSAPPAPAANAVPQRREGADLADGLQRVVAELRAHRSARTRLLAWLWPASMGLRGAWGNRRNRGDRNRRH